ncbi:MAG: endonuclease/exonuclease/phosphatase family protein [Rhodanobacteraceae bacterium]
MTELRVATYNVHSGRGVDGRFRPERISAVIAELRADVIALQEYVSLVRDFDLRDHLMRATGFQMIAMSTMKVGAGDFGNAILSRWPIVDAIEHGLSVGRYEPRGALEVILGRGQQPELRVIATHLGLRDHERRTQLARLIEIVKRDAKLPTVLAGDFNIARLQSVAFGACRAHFGHSHAPRSFPSFAPMLPLDRVWVSPCSALVSVAAHRSSRARIASDHLPVVATLELPDPSE